MARAGRQADEVILEVLHMRDVEGWSYDEIGEALGISASGLRVMVCRIRREEQPCACIKPENKDGAMRPGWWRKKRG